MYIAIPLLIMPLYIVYINLSELKSQFNIEIIICLQRM